MEYINTDFDKYDIKHGQLTETPLRGSTTRYIANPIVDDIEAEPKGRARRRRINGRIVIDTTVPDGDGARYVPPSCLVTGDASVNNLATHRWHNDGLPNAETEADLIRRVQSGDHRAFRKLLEAFHRTVVGPAGKYIPGGAFYRRQPKNQKHTNDLLYEDLTSVGCLALWQSTLKFDSSHRFNTLSRHKIVGAISNEANYLRRGGYTSGDTVGRYSWKKVGRRTQTRLDRWIFDHRGSPPEELLEAQKKLVKRPVFHSLEEAASAIKAASSLDYSDVYSDDGEDGGGDIADTAATEPTEQFRDAYDFGNLSPQLAIHREHVSPIVDFWINELCSPPRIKAKPNPKPTYKPCMVKPTGRALHPIDKPYWMEPRELRVNEYAKKPHDPDRREVATIRLKGGKTKRMYRQIAAGPCRQIYVKSANQRGKNVRPERSQTISRPTAEIVVLESRGGGIAGLHVSERYNSPRISERSAGTGIAVRY